MTLDPDGNFERQPITLIQSNHPKAFRPHQWATIIGVELVTPSSDTALVMHDRVCFRVEYPDARQDLMPIFDRDGQYAFARGPL